MINDNLQVFTTEVLKLQKTEFTKATNMNSIGNKVRIYFIYTNGFFHMK